jgi:cholesterol oxidase
MQHDYDFIIVGSGFGGSVSALRLSEKGYRVLVVEKGKRWMPGQFPRTNWKLRKWLWLPPLRLHGFFKMTFMRHVGILSGVGVGGGSLVYGNTLPRPARAYFRTGSWAGLVDWEKELEPHYREAERMLGATRNPCQFDSDLALKEVAARYGKEGLFEPTRVSVFFGEPEQEVADPYFEGKGPRRSGCTHCGACMTGCRYDAKNSLDKNYLYLAEKLGTVVMEGRRVVRIEPLDSSPETNRQAGKADGSQGYRVVVRESMAWIKQVRIITCRGIVLSGGVLGTVRLLLDMKRKWLKYLSDRVGDTILTNNESLVLVHSRKREKDFSKGLAIGSIFPPDHNTHLEPVRYGSGSGFWKIMAVPLTHGGTVAGRIMKLLIKLITRPAGWLRIYTSRNFAKESVILLFMQHLESTLAFRRGFLNLRSAMSSGAPPSSFIPFAKELAEVTSEVVEGKPFVMLTEALTGIPTTAHILGGCGIGKDAGSGVIDSDHRVFGYRNMFVCDGSAISANPGVNPSLTIAAMTERVMSKIPEKV